MSLNIFSDMVMPEESLGKEKGKSTFLSSRRGHKKQRPVVSSDKDEENDKDKDKDKDKEETEYYREMKSEYYPEDF